MNTSEVLNRAADLIEERGWTQGPDGWGSRGGPPLCLEGGLLCALGIRGNFTGALALYASPAYAALTAYLGLDPKPWTMPLKDTAWLWNDAPERTAAEVVEALRACAVIEAAKETAEIEAVVSC